MNQPSTKNNVVLTVVWFLGFLSLVGLVGTIYLCHLNTNPDLVGAAVKMIQTDPSSAMAAMNLLRADAAVIAIVSGLTGVCIGGLNGMLNNTRSHNDNETVREVTAKTSTAIATGTPAPGSPDFHAASQFLINTTHPMKTFRALTLLTIFAISLPGCETGADRKKQLTPKAKQALTNLGSDVLDISENALAGAAGAMVANVATQGISGRSFDATELQVSALNGALNGAAASVRTLEGRRTAPTAAEISTAIAQGTGNPDVSAVLAPGVSGAIAAAVAKGAPVNLAIETAAVKLDAKGVQ